MSEQAVMWAVWAAMAAADALVVIYFIRTVLSKRGNHGD